jgi:hypothetical protein
MPSTIASCRDKLAEFEAEVRQLRVESVHRLNPVLALIPTLDSRLRSEVALHVRDDLPAPPPLAAADTTWQPQANDEPQQLIGDTFSRWTNNLSGSTSH